MERLDKITPSKPRSPRLKKLNKGVKNFTATLAATWSNKRVNIQYYRSHYKGKN